MISPFIAALIFFYSLPVFATSPKLVIFTLHGFFGDQTTFCDLKNILEEDYEQEVAVQEIIYYNYLTVKTGLQQGMIDNKDIRDFTKEVYRQMMDYYLKNNIDFETPFAIIAHSQGGIIAMRYVADCIYRNEFYCSGKLNGRSITPRNLKYFITLGTPFWGSTAANHIKILDFIQTLLPVQQVSDLSMGSSIITYNREMSLEPLLKDRRNIFPEKTEVINISSDISKTFLGSIFKLATEKGTNKLIEHDLVVPLFSANIDYHFKLYPKDKDGYALIGRTNMGSYYYPINGYHAEYGFMQGIACVKRSRQDKTKYQDNTVYLILRKHFDTMLSSVKRAAVEKLQEADRFVTDLQTFNMEVKLNLPKKDTWFRKISFQKKHVKPFSEDPLIVDMVRKDSLLFHRFRGFNYDYSGTDLNYITYYHTAFFDRGYFLQGINSDFSVKNINPYTAEFGFQIQIPWFKPVTITAPVSPANTTFVEYNLEPIEKKILPFIINEEENRLTTDGNQIIAVQEGVFSVKVFEFHPKTHRGSIRIRTIAKNNWQTELPAVSNKGYEAIYNECYIATLTPKRFGKDNFYLGFYDNKEQRLRKPGNTKYTEYFDTFKVIGRYAEGSYNDEEQVYEQDRVLVTNPTLMRHDRDISLQSPRADQYLRKGYYWVNTKDVRLVEPCSKEDFLPESL